MARDRTVLNGLVLFGVLFQGVSAGLFMGHLDASAWQRVHQATAIATMVVALLAVLVAIRRRALIAPTVGLFVLLVVQTGLGEAIAEDHQRALLAAHVPVAVLVTALSAYLFAAAAARRVVT